jgi:O-antigen/teichoic acid export membrane protein
MVVLTLFASALNYGSNILFSHVLAPVGYGELTALFALSVVLAVPTGAAQTMLADRIAVHNAEGRMDRVRYIVRHAGAHVAVISVVAGVLYVAATPLVVKGLSLRHAGVALALTPVLVLGFMQPLALGVLQGLERFTAYGVLLLAIAVSRIGFGLPWAAVEHGAGGALGGQAVGMLVVLCTAAWFLRRLNPGRGTGAATSGLKRRPDARTLSASGVFIGFAVLSNLDLILAKIFLNPHDAGVYAALSTIGKVIIFLPAAITVVMVPSAAKARHNTGSSARVLRVSALLVAGASVLVAIPAILAPSLIIKVMFGSKYLEAVSGVLPMVIAGAGFAMTYLLVVYAVAIGDRKWVSLLVCAVVVQIVGVAAFHGSPTQIATVQAAVAMFVLVGNEILFHPIISTKRSLTQRVVPR